MRTSGDFQTSDVHILSLLYKFDSLHAKGGLAKVGGKVVERLGSLCSGPDGRGRETAGYHGPYFLQVSEVHLMLHVEGEEEQLLGVS